MKKRRLLFFSLFAFVLLPAVAQEPEEPVYLTFRTLGLTGKLGDELYYRGEEAFERFHMDYFRASREMKGRLAENGSLPLFRKTEDPENPEEVIYVVERSVRIPKEMDQVLILAARVKDQLVLNSIEDNRSENIEDWMFINLSGNNIRVQVGDGTQLINVRRRQSAFQKVEVDNGKGIAVRVFARREDGWKRIYSRFWAVYPNQRSMMIVMDVGEETKVFNFYEPVKPPPVVEVEAP